jgi:hypothetical protein
MPRQLAKDTDEGDVVMTNSHLAVDADGEFVFAG